MPDYDWPYMSLREVFGEDSFHHHEGMGLSGVAGEVFLEEDFSLTGKCGEDFSQLEPGSWPYSTVWLVSFVGMMDIVETAIEY